MKRQPSARYPKVRYQVSDRAALRALRRLPWKVAISGWRDQGVSHLRVRRGLGRHPIVFVRAGGEKFVIKELGPGGARREIAVYTRLREMGIETLEPVGIVIREEPPIPVDSPAGRHFTENAVGHSVTRLAERVLPDSLLFPLGLARESRRRILSAVLDLFVDLHVNGAYWGDASLANTLIRFGKEDVPHVGRRTRLQAVLADAETVEIRQSLSRAIRQADLETFLDSMRWTHEDLRLGGLLRDARAAEEDGAYLVEEYEERWRVGEAERAFRERTGLDVRAMLGRVRDPAYLGALERHIEEHKWYVSEQGRSEVPLPEAAARWYAEVFVPVCGLFQEEDVLALFPGKSASDLYVEVMTHKYFLSEQQKADVGMAAALEDYAARFGRQPGLAAFWAGVARKMVQVLGLGDAS